MCFLPPCFVIFSHGFFICCCGYYFIINLSVYLLLLSPTWKENVCLVLLKKSDFLADIDYIMVLQYMDYHNVEKNGDKENFRKKKHRGKRKT